MRERIERIVDGVRCDGEFVEGMQSDGARCDGEFVGGTQLIFALEQSEAEANGARDPAATGEAFEGGEVPEGADQ